MKHLITILMLIMSATVLASVQDISKEEYLKLLKQNETTFSEVRPGMRTEFYETFNIYTDDIKTDTCEVNGEAVIVATSSTHYLVYFKEEIKRECEFHDKGKIIERLNWRKIHTIEDEDNFINNLTQYKIQRIDNELVRMIGKIKYPDSSDEMPFSKIIDLKKSQFTSVLLFSDSETKYIKYWNDEVDPSSIDIRKFLNVAIN